MAMTEECSSHDKLAVAAMRGNFCILELDVMNGKLGLLEKYQGKHSSLAYGIDWLPSINRKSKDLIASASFYDNCVTLWSESGEKCS